MARARAAGVGAAKRDERVWAGYREYRVTLKRSNTSGRGEWAVRSGLGNDWLCIWGLKVVLDGGPEGAALDQPFTSDPTAQGHLNWDPNDLFAVADAAVKRGWKIATHALGDRTVRTLIDVYERVIAANPNLPPRSLVIEHGFLADREQRARAIRLGIPVTVQHPLLYGMAGTLLRLWGPERTRNIMPVRAWLAEGAQVSAGTDYPAGPVDPIQAIWGMVTRANVAMIRDEFAQVKMSTSMGAGGKTTEVVEEYLETISK
ncbi:MAG: amidohydrolase family protein [Ktedonobacterales bacterium]